METMLHYKPKEVPDKATALTQFKRRVNLQWLLDLLVNIPNTDAILCMNASNLTHNHTVK